MSRKPNPVVDGCKTCKRCSRSTQIALFSKNKTSKDGLGTYCKACVALYSKSYSTRNAEGVRAKRKAYRELNKERNSRWQREYRQKNPDKCREQSKAKYLRNRDKILAKRSENAEDRRNKNRAYRERNKDALREYGKEFRAKNAARLSAERTKRMANDPAARATAKAWRDANKGRLKDAYDRRRARLLNARIQHFTLEQLRMRLLAQGHVCVYCGGPFEHVDHVKALANGGPHCLANLRPACRKCNLSKKAQSALTWIRKCPKPVPLPLP